MAGVGVEWNVDIHSIIPQIYRAKVYNARTFSARVLNVRATKKRSTMPAVACKVVLLQGIFFLASPREFFFLQRCGKGTSR